MYGVPLTLQMWSTESQLLLSNGKYSSSVQKYTQIKIDVWSPFNPLNVKYRITIAAIQWKIQL